MIFDREVDMSLNDYIYWTELEAEWEEDDMYFQMQCIKYNEKTQYYYIDLPEYEGIEFISEEEAAEYIRG